MFLDNSSSSNIVFCTHFARDNLVILLIKQIQFKLIVSNILNPYKIK